MSEFGCGIQLSWRHRFDSNIHTAIRFASRNGAEADPSSAIRMRRASPTRNSECRSGEIGRHAWFRTTWGQPRGGSSPLSGTIFSVPPRASLSQSFGSGTTTGKLVSAASSTSSTVRHLRAGANCMRTERVETTVVPALRLWDIAKAPRPQPHPQRGGVGSHISPEVPFRQ